MAERHRCRAQETSRRPNAHDVSMLAMPTALIHDPRFLKHETGDHPETPLRLEAIESELEASESLWAELTHVQPRLASSDDIVRCHSSGLVDAVREAAASGVPGLDADTRIGSESFEVARLAAGAVMRGVDLVVGGDASNAFAAVRPPGHHARPDQAMGFCLFNNVAIAARYAQSRHGVERVMIVDWDVHHGNGTQEIFYDDPSVFFVSTHQYPWYPGTGARSETGAGRGDGTTLNVPLLAGTPARSHREAFRSALDAAENVFHPDFVFISAGFDSRREDPLGGLMLEDEDFREMTEEVMDLADRVAGGRVVSVLEGGYNLANLGGSAVAHVSALAGRTTRRI